LDTPELILITALALLFIGSYGAGALYNRLKSNRILKRIWRQLKIYGVSGEYTSLGSSGFIIRLKNPTKKIKALEITIVLGKREFPINWIIDLIRGKRDNITIKSIFEKKPKYEIDIFKRGNYYGNILARKLGDNVDTTNQIYVYPKGNLNKEKVSRITDFFNKNKGIWWASLRKTPPHLLIIGSLNIANNINKVIKLVTEIA
jgi:hypothetical protein